MLDFNICPSLDILSSSHTYPIYIGQQLINCSDILSQHIDSSNVFILTNETVAPLYLASLMNALEKYQCHSYIISDGETYKTFETYQQIVQKLLSLGLSRDTTILSLGGGVICDIAGFVAATYHRGVKLIHLPTTLLAQVDASVGGKTGVNVNHIKNCIGAFYQPNAVVVDLTSLVTLTEREYLSGFGEVVKYALLFSAEKMDNIYQHAHLIHARCPVYLKQLIVWCLDEKRKIVSDDENETGSRAKLNLGHTFAHAIESATQGECYLHGEAVAIGLYCCVSLSIRLGQLEHSTLNQLSRLLDSLKLSCKLFSPLLADTLFKYMAKDKKVKEGKINFVLLSAIGHAYITSDVKKQDVKCVLQEVGAV